jgi:ABC-2 type transport system permease protein
MNVLSKFNTHLKRISLIGVGVGFLILISNFFYFRIDLTSDKRFTISEPTKKLIEKVETPIQVTVYLDGDLNPGFLRLKKATADLFEELSANGRGKFVISYENPSAADNDKERNEKYTKLATRGLIPTAVYERDKEGKAIQKVIFPWIEIAQNGKRIPICLLKNIRGNSGEENLNVSVENLEFEITDGIRRLLRRETPKIAFIEGHGELNEAETYDISKTLSKYFQIDRGVIATDAAILNPYKCIIIAKPTKPYTETEKFILDQYIMNGGRVLWLIDGVRIAKENLSKNGLSPAMELDVNLSDQLFRYGIRINPVIIQDVQCASIPINIAPAGEKPQFEPSPWFYSPLLLASNIHPVTKNITEVKADFCSGIDQVGDNKDIKYSLLLASSDNSHILGTPTTIDLARMPKAKDRAYFNASYCPVAVGVEGNFESDFANRIPPKGISNTLPLKSKSVLTRQIFVADGDIIRNETTGVASDSTTIPLGYDRYMRQQFGNRDFIQNAVQYLTDNEGWMQLRFRTIKLRLLNKRITSDEKVIWQLGNTLLPLVVLIIFGISFQLVRRRKYTKR